uniref:Uncharacterized protein n=1 Tax=Daphnia galeata TaxID=27404 RepID=A0A8J2RF13_9CRUS|nr:unnamed protein product [Daphnia galeata]
MSPSGFFLYLGASNIRLKSSELCCTSTFPCKLNFSYDRMSMADRSKIGLPRGETRTVKGLLFEHTLKPTYSI